MLIIMPNRPSGKLRFALLAAGAAAMVGVGACAPSDPLPAQFVAARASGNTADVLYTACDPQSVVAVALLKSSNNTVYSETDPAVWKITFSAGTHSTQFTVGDLPTGAVSSVALDSSLKRDTLYVAEVDLADGHSYYQPFVLNKMGANIAYYNTYLSQAQFDKKRSC
jgi:hypothetical protein